MSKSYVILTSPFSRSYSRFAPLGGGAGGLWRGGDGAQAIQEGRRGEALGEGVAA